MRHCDAKAVSVSALVALADMEELAFELNLEGARLARAAADEAATSERPRFVAGAIGPTNRTASISPDVNDPGKRNTDFETLAASYGEAARGLIEGGADALLIETIFDTLNAKAAIYAVQTLFDALGYEVPIMAIPDKNQREWRRWKAYWRSRTGSRWRC